MAQIKQDVKPSNMTKVKGKFKLNVRPEGPNYPYWEQTPQNALFTYMGMSNGISFVIGNDAKLFIKVNDKLNLIEVFKALEATTVNNVAFNLQFDYGIDVDYELRFNKAAGKIKLYRQGIEIFALSDENFKKLESPKFVYWFDAVQQNKGRNNVTVTNTKAVV